MSLLGSLRVPELENNRVFPPMTWASATNSPCLSLESLSFADGKAGPEFPRGPLQGGLFCYQLRREDVGEAEGLLCLCLGGSGTRREHRG